MTAPVAMSRLATLVLAALFVSVVAPGPASAQTTTLTMSSWVSPGTFDAVRDGLIDLSYVTASKTPAWHVLPSVAELPGGGDTPPVNSVLSRKLPANIWRAWPGSPGTKPIEGVSRY